MCIPLAAAALIVSAVGVGVSAYGAVKGAKTSKAQAQLDEKNNLEQAALSNENADRTLSTGKINADMVRTIAGVNNQITAKVAGINTSMVTATTDFNVGMIKGTMDFNVSSAEGAAAILEAQGEAESTAHGFNAQVYEFQAQDAIEQGGQAERASRTAYAQIKGKQRAALAANGVTLDEGSALRIQSDTDYASDVDASTIKGNALKAALGYRVSAANEQMAGRVATLNAKGAALEKRTEAIAARINGETAIAQETIGGAQKKLDIQMTSSFAMLQTSMDAEVESMNINQQAENDAWAMRAQGKGYTGQAAQARLSAKSISPALVGATTALTGLGQVGMQGYQMYKAGAFKG